MLHARGPITVSCNSREPITVSSNRTDRNISHIVLAPVWNILCWLQCGTHYVKYTACLWRNMLITCESKKQAIFNSGDKNTRPGVSVVHTVHIGTSSKIVNQIQKGY